MKWTLVGFFVGPDNEIALRVDDRVGGQFKRLFKPHLIGDSPAA